MEALEFEWSIARKFQYARYRVRIVGGELRKKGIAGLEQDPCASEVSFRPKTTRVLTRKNDSFDPRG